MDVTHGPTITLTWANVGLGLAFIFLNALISFALHLGVGGALLTAAVRCIVQLNIMGLVLQGVFETNNPWVVGGIAFTLNLLGTFEAVVNRSKRRHDTMFLSVLASMLASTVPVSIIGARYAMMVDPFWTPGQYIPMVGMLCGSTVSAVVVSLSYVLKEIQDNQDKIETYLAFGATRFEACWPIAREGLRLALTPNINSMSVTGMVSIPGMMTGAILGGSSVEQAARLQMIMLFTLSASTTFAAILTTVTALSVVADGEHRIRQDRIDIQEHPIWRMRHWMLAQIMSGGKHLIERCHRRGEKRSEWELSPSSTVKHALLPEYS